MQKRKRIILPTLLIMAIITSCNQPAALKVSLPEKTSLKNNIRVKTSLKGTVEFPPGFSTKASVNDIASNTTVSIINPSTFTTVASGTTNGSGSFTINPDENFNPPGDSFWILEASRRVGGVGSRLMSIRTYIQWVDDNWESITFPTIKINSQTTALSIIREIYTPPENPVSTEELIGKINVGQSPSVFSPFGNVDQEMLDNVTGLVNIVLEKESDPVSSIAYNNDNFEIVNPPDIIPTPTPEPTPDPTPTPGTPTPNPNPPYDPDFEQQFPVNTSQNTRIRYYESESAINQADGSYLVVWSSDSNSGNNNYIYGQKYDSGFNPIGLEMFLEEFGGQSPEVAIASNGNFVVAWVKQNNAYFRIFGNTGTPISDAIVINPENESPNENVSVTMNQSNGSFIVAFSSPTGVFAQRYNSDGTPNGSRIQVSTEATGFWNEVSIVEDNTGKFVVAFSYVEVDTTIKFVMKGRKFNGDGSPVDINDFNISNFDTKTKVAPSVDIDNNFNFVVSWASREISGSNFEIMARVFNNNAVPQTNQFMVNDTTTGNQTWPKTGVKGNGNFIIAWEGGAYTFIKQYDSAGNPIDTEMTVSNNSSVQSTGLSVNKTTGNYLVTWQSPERQEEDEVDPENPGPPTFNFYTDIFGIFLNF
jgi:hypothetical protein